jgi:hypothetical protein
VHEHYEKAEEGESEAGIDDLFIVSEIADYDCEKRGHCDAECDKEDHCGSFLEQMNLFSAVFVHS